MVDELALCKHSDNNHIFDITPVENLFLHEFMLKAPGDFVKVYLFGLMQCYNPDCTQNTIEAFSHALGLEISDVENAFRYWERQGVLELCKDSEDKLSIKFHNIKDLLYNKGLDTEKSVYKYRDFNQNLQHIFDTRLLSPQEYLRVYDWIEVLNLPQEVVLMMVRFYVTRKSSKISINYLDKVAQSWAKDGIDTLQKAEDYIQSNDDRFKNTVTVLKYLGIYRSPSKAELDMCNKWTNSWGFEMGAILAAAQQTTKVHTPNFAYLDKILYNLHSKGYTSRRAIETHLDTREGANDKLKEVYRQLGYKNNAPTPEHLSMYKEWIEVCKIEHGVILLAARQCVRKKTNSFESLDNLLREWLKNGLVTEPDINTYLNKRKLLDNEIMAVFERAGDTGKIAMRDRKLYKQWSEEWKMPFELILLAAEYSTMAKQKMPYINKILSSWHANNIKTLKGARADQEAHVQKQTGSASKGKATKKQLDFNKFPQHTYSDEDLEQLFDNIEDL
ncbi:MAG TPA: DnaD domain protein [Bacillota bacterium]|nr:DnaD domain protein [Bacillota bacterium]